MLNSGGKNILTLVVVSEKFVLNETKKPYPPLQVKWSVPYIYHAITTTAVPFPHT